MRRQCEPFLAWPGWELLAQTLVLALPVTLWWGFVYHGANWLTGQINVRDGTSRHETTIARRDASATQNRSYLHTAIRGTT